jgi:hypothetical protein
VRVSVLKRALKRIEAHHDFQGWQGEPEISSAGEHTVHFGLGVDMPPAWAQAGRSPTGVKPVEPITVRFPPGFPAAVPEFAFRADFPRSFPHLLPMNPGESPRPCLVLGSVENLFRQRGIDGMLDQLYSWLFKAAHDRLNDDPDTWEPARRDTVAHRILVNQPTIHALSTSRSTVTYLHGTYAGWGVTDEVIHQIEVSEKTTTLAASTWANLHQQHFKTGHFIGSTICAVFSPEKLASGEPYIADTYFPDDVVDIESLKRAAATWRCGKALSGFLDTLDGHAKKIRQDRVCKSVPIALLFNIRRPRTIVGTSSTVEALGYVIEMTAQRGVPVQPRSRVRPSAVLEQTNAALLRRFNQQAADQNTKPWTLLGCGSLGSKMALHMTRSGRAPRLLIDPELMSAHNYARHGCVPTSKAFAGDYYPRPKAAAVWDLTEALAQVADFRMTTIQALLLVEKERETLARQSEWLLVNTTGSVPVRNALTSSLPTTMRMAEGTLLSRGRIGYFAIEGPSRNPNLGELWAASLWLYALDPESADMVFSDSAQLEAIQVGHGCGTETMPVSDAAISLQAGGMSVELARGHEQGLSAESGALLISKLQSDGISLQWRRHAVAPFRRVLLESSDEVAWTLHLSELAHQKIQSEVARHPRVETGGVLWGYVNDAIGAIYVLDVIDAPADSKRGADRFDLGTEGLQELLSDRRRSSNGALDCVGTWHSHLVDSEPSTMDRETAEEIAQGSISTNALLIVLPSGYCGLLAEIEKEGRND